MAGLWDYNNYFLKVPLDEFICLRINLWENIKSFWAFLVSLSWIFLSVEVINSKGYVKKYLKGFISIIVFKNYFHSIRGIIGFNYKAIRGLNKSFVLITEAAYIHVGEAKMSDDIKKRFDFPNSLIQSQVIFIYFYYMVTNEPFSWTINWTLYFHMKYFLLLITYFIKQLFLS